jgi:hypothetical protein
VDLRGIDEDARFLVRDDGVGLPGGPEAGRELDE